MSVYRRITLTSALLLAACHSFDAKLLSPGPSAGSNGGASGQGGAAGRNGSAGRSAGGTSGVGAEDAGMDAATTQVAAGCVPNPNTANEVCPEICPEVCDGQDNDCDRRIDEGSALCQLAHASGTCTEGECVVTSCTDRYRDCNGLDADGCEVSPSDPKNCGFCAHACALENASAICAAGKCKVAQCAPGYGDCDGDGSSCETSLSSLANCGGCASTGENDACMSLPNAATSCAAGSCQVAKCLGDFGDCDADHLSCETELNTGSNCGACGHHCMSAGSPGDCSTGTCLAGACGSGYFDCDASPSTACDSLDDPANCGGCGKHCGPDPDPNVHNHVVTAKCAAMSCSIESCQSLFGDCDHDPFNGCETTLTTTQNCAACGKTCDEGVFPGANVSCSSGSCQLVSCKSGFGDCSGGPADGCETPLNTSAHCGACLTTCGPGQFCNGGACSAVDCHVAPHATDCGQLECGDCDHDGASCETDLRTVTHCLACGTACAFNSGPTPVGTLVCKSTGCAVTCPAGYADCDGNYKNGCESLTTLTNCGGCSVGCSIANATATCASGACRVQQCSLDRADCDADGLSCESSLAAPSTCGACNVSCTPDNAVGACLGTPGSRACGIAACIDGAHKDCNALPTDGCEIDTRSDVANCGACGNDCRTQSNVATASCVNSACVIDSCTQGWLNCSAASGCETPGNTVQNCGACNDDCGASLANTKTTACDATSLTCKIVSCNSGFGNCDGMDANGCEPLDTVTNCTSCGTPCVFANGSGTCASQSCTLASCNNGWHNCDGNVANGCESSVACPSLGYTASNFDANALPFGSAPSTTLNCQGTTTIDTSGSVTITNWCGSKPVPVIQGQTNGPDLVILPLQGLTIAASTTLRVVGTRPLVFAVLGNVVIAGTLDASASATTSGAGGNWSCGASAGGNGTGRCAYMTGGSGGGGGGFKTVGGTGGKANTESFPASPANIAGGTGGATRGASTVSPLFGGCAGGIGGSDGAVTAGGGSGGAVQISGSGSLTVSGAIRANGASGQVGCGLTGNGEGGGAGGGSGGAILLEARSITTSGATLEAKGGKGGDAKCACSPPPGGNGASSAANPGANGSGSMGGGSGGGGGYGWVLQSVIP